MSTSQPISTNVTASLSTAMSSPLLPMFLGMVAIVSWFGVFMVTSRANSEDYNKMVWRGIKDQVSKVISSSMLGMFILLVTSVIYFLQDETKSIYIIFILVTFATILSYSAFAASTVN
jgi:hypothetical protein